MSNSGKYQILRKLGRGSGSTVYLASSAAGEVAIRQLPANAEAGDRARFIAAGRQQMTLSDPSMVPTLEVIDNAAEASVVMKYIESPTLQTTLMQRRFQPEESNVLLRRVALALDFAHSRGVVHGDLKPSNIFLMPDREVMVGDIGMGPPANRDQSKPLPAHLAHGYLSPEHFSVPMSLEARSDQYSLAVIAYEMYTDHLPPVSERSTQVGERESYGADPKLRPAVHKALTRALSRNPGLRFNSCMEFVSELSAGLVGAKPVRPRKSGWLPLAVGLGLVIAAVGGVLFMRSAGKPPVLSVTAAVVPDAPKAPPSRSTPSRPKDKMRKTGAVQTVEKAVSPISGAATVAVTKSAVQPPRPIPVEAQREFTIEVLSRGRRIRENSSFAMDDSTLGELAHGDLKALVQVEGPLVPPNHLTIEWKVDGQVTDRQRPVSPNEPAEYNNEPIEGTYKVTLLWDKRPLKSFVFQITP